MSLVNLLSILKGGSGSGNKGHAGIHGHRGGSSSNGISFLKKELGAKAIKTGSFDSVLGQPTNFEFGDVTVQTSIRETSKEIFLNSIATKYSNDLTKKFEGTGKGSLVINALRKYSDKTGKKLIVPDATDKAKPFWDKVSFLKRDYNVHVNFDGEDYVPPNTYSYEPKGGL